MASFRFLDGDGRRPPSFLPRSGASLPDAVSAPRGRLGGFIAGEPHPGSSTLDALRRQMLKDRIREEMRQEMAERQIIEEEVRQEMAEQQEMAERQMLEEEVRQELAKMEERRLLEQEVLQELGMERAMGHHRLPPLALAPPLPLALRPPARLALPPPQPAPLPMPRMPERSMLIERHLPLPEPRFADVREESPVTRVCPMPNVWKEPAFSRSSSEPEVDEQERISEATIEGSSHRPGGALELLQELRNRWTSGDNEAFELMQELNFFLIVIRQIENCIRLCNKEKKLHQVKVPNIQRGW